jgi:hypothetical protein
MLVEKKENLMLIIALLTLMFVTATLIAPLFVTSLSALISSLLRERIASWLRS